MKSTLNSRIKNKSGDSAIPVVKELKMKTKKKIEKKETEKKETEKKDKFGNEIDEIFKIAAKNKKKELSMVIGTKKPQGEKEARRKDVSKKHDVSLDGGGDITRRKTTDGIKIYSSEELRFNDPNAGGTPLCPFDCDCCF